MTPARHSPHAAETLRPGLPEPSEPRVPLPDLAMETDWKLQQRLWGHGFHPMCSYLGSFPAALAHAFIGRYSRPGDVVFDPFSGRGTVALQACAERRIGVGLDINPLATLLTGAKVDPPTLRQVDARLDELRIDWSRQEPDWVVMARAVSADPVEASAGLEHSVVPAAHGGGRTLEQVPRHVAVAFHPRTLGQLLFLRSVLDRSGSADRFLLAAIVGILHGRSASYLSTAMPNAFSLAPDYTRRWVADRGVAPPDRDAFRLLRAKLRRLFRDGRPGQQGVALGGDAREAGPLISAVLRARGLPARARLVITSPPYLRLIRYGSYNWLRLWFLGHDPAVVDRDTTPPVGSEAYGRFLREVLESMRQVLTDDAVVVVVLGDVLTDRGRPRSTIASLADQAWHLAAEPAGYALAGVVADDVAPGRKLTRMWGPEAGRATVTDRLLILGASDAGRRRAVAGAGTPADWSGRIGARSGRSMAASRPSKRRAAAILAAYAADVSPGRSGVDGSAGPDEESGSRPDDQPEALLRPPAAAPPVRAGGQPGA